ncbi:MAG: endopeptidase La [Lachnospiraceae bacterium]|nr:endopeptidase La [Lachnospiraceae bacterium]
MKNEIKVMPVVALRNVAVLPGMLVHFDVNRKMSIQAVEQAMKSDQIIFAVTQKDASVDEPAVDDLYSVGCVARIKQIIKLPGNLVRVLITGEKRGELDYLVSVSPYLSAQITVTEQESSEQLSEVEKRAMIGTLHDLLSVYFTVNGNVGKDVAEQLYGVTELERLMEQIAALIPLTTYERQTLLEEAEFFARFELLAQILANEIEELRIRKDLQAKVKAKVEKNQKEYVLREQLKVIREELGETDEAEEFANRLSKLQASEEVKSAIAKEIERYRRLGGAASESAVARTYIETLLAMPWDAATEESYSLEQAGKILERDHYGMEKVKERILQYLAVRKRTGTAEGTILCLVGPPGTGKTSIAHSVAEALGKKYVRVCLGGVRDEAEIRGHRRTYIGAMPGRIAAGIKQAGVKNPLMLLDEIDKVASDYKGDPSAALLEVLDPEQNAHFMDHYLDMPLDLSEVLFIATANTLQTIPKPLLDRMEVIELSGYTETEKFFIAKRYLLKKQLKKNGLTAKEMKVTDGALKAVISGYTKEAGVRKLEERLGELCRKTVWNIDAAKEKPELPIRISEKDLFAYLGKRKYLRGTVEKKPQIGLVRGLAWTSVGGDTLEIEVNVMPGKGGITLTGKLGDVMKESAQTALSFVRAYCGDTLTEEYFEKHQIHVHVPEGAVPKDGPSAGITMATAIYSAVTGKKVLPDVAMTGEVTLRGRVLPIGGLKEKLLAAKQAGVKKVLVPKQNEADVQELEEEVTNGLEIVTVETMEQVLSEALLCEKGVKE